MKENFINYRDRSLIRKKENNLSNKNNNGAEYRNYKTNYLVNAVLQDQGGVI